MKRILSAMLFACSALIAQTEVIGSAGDVDLLRQERMNSQKEHTGYDYYAQNKGTTTATVKVALDGTQNILNGLVPGTVEVAPGTTEPLGWIEQKDASTAAKWRLTWKVTEQTPAPTEK